MSLQSKVLKTLQSGRKFSSGQMAGLFDTTEASIVARVAELRAKGFSIYSTTAKNGKTVYHLGQPSYRMVAAAYAAAGSSVFSS